MIKDLIPGLTPSQNQQLIELFCNQSVIESVTLYGSRAKGNFKPGSDIDLSFKGEGLTMSWLLDLSLLVDDLLLPYEFDLTIFSHIENSDLREHIERVGKVIYEKG